MTGSLRVLVVDDEEVIRDVLAALLEREGWQVTTASNGARALSAFEAEPYDVVLLDLMLPDRSGLEVLRDIRRKDPDAVVVIVTAYSSIEPPRGVCSRIPGGTILAQPAMIGGR